MYIPAEKILNKIEEQLSFAKQANSEVEIRGKIQVIKALCDLLLDEQNEEKQWSIPTSIVKKGEPQKTVIDDEDGANGESLFDF